MTIDRSHAWAVLFSLYERFHKPEYIHPDPLELVRAAAPSDREIVALIASSFALGRVDLIVTAVTTILATLESPAEALATLRRRDIRRLFHGFRYRFFSGGQLANLLWGIGETIRRYGSLEACFRSGIERGDTNTLPALRHFARELRRAGDGDMGILLSDPDKGSASKRLHLFLRWMVRRDAIDPGGWRVPARMLLVPADVHMVRVSRLLGFTDRRQPDLRTALEITSALAAICPDDPVKFDFSMTRLGIHPALSYAHLYERAPDPSIPGKTGQFEPTSG